MQLDLGGVIAGVVLAVVSGTLIPFFTSQFAAWTADRRARREGQVKALSDYLTERARRDDADHAESRRMTREGRSGAVVSGYSGDFSAARLGLLARFGVFDGSLREVFRFVENWDRPEDIAVLGTWAGGHPWIARYWASRRVRQHEAVSARAREESARRAAATEAATTSESER